MKRFVPFGIRVLILACACLLIACASALASSIEAYGLKISRPGSAGIDYYVSDMYKSIRLTEGGEYTVEMADADADGCIYLDFSDDATLTLKDVRIVGRYDFAPITLAGNANLTVIFEGDCALTGWKTPAIFRDNTDRINSLNIKSGAEGATLNLVSRADYCAALGTASDTDLWNLNIDLDHAGSGIYAEGGPHGAGIGTGARGSVKYLTINMDGEGSYITAKGGLGAAGIGSGFFGNVDMLNLNINAGGCTVTSEGGQGAAGIGAGFKGDVNVLRILSDASKAGAVGSAVTGIGRDGGAGIGAGERYNGYGGKATGIEITVSTSDVITGRSVSSDASIPGGAGIGSGAKGALESLEIHGGKIVAEGGVGAAGIGSGAGGFVSSYGVQIFQDISFRKTSVNAKGGAYGPGIGSGFGIETANPYEIVITGGYVKAQGGQYAAGIGGGYKVSSNNIKITGSEVVATGGEYGAGIGGGKDGSMLFYGNLIEDATVTATGGKYAPGIGGSSGMAVEGLTIGEGAFVTAVGGDMAAGIGGALFCNASGINLVGGHVTATGGTGAPGIGGGKYGKLTNLVISGGTHVINGATVVSERGTVSISGGSVKAEFDNLPVRNNTEELVMREIRLKYMRDDNPPDAYSMTMFRTGEFAYGFTDVTPAVDGLDGVLYLWLPSDVDVLTLTTGSAAGRTYNRLLENLGQYPLSMYDHNYLVTIDGAEYASGNFANTLELFEMIGTYGEYTLSMEKGVTKSDAYIDAAYGESVIINNLNVVIYDWEKPAIYAGDGALTLAGENSFVIYKAGQSAVAGNVLAINGGGKLNASALDAPAILTAQSLTINGGVISAVTDAAGVPAIKAGGISNIEITGGTISAVSGGAAGEIRPAEGCAVEITGGSVNADIAWAVRGTQTLHKQALSVNSGVDFATAHAKVTNLELYYTSGGNAFAYGINDMYTDESGRIYLWTPDGVSLKSITVGGETITPPGGLALDGTDKSISGSQYVVTDKNGGTVSGLETETGLFLMDGCAVSLAPGLEKASKPISIVSGGASEIRVALNGVKTSGGVSVLRSDVTLAVKDAEIGAGVSLLRGCNCFVVSEGASRIAAGLTLTGDSSDMLTNYILSGTGEVYLGAASRAQYMTVQGGTWRFNNLAVDEHIEIYGGSVFFDNAYVFTPMRGSAPLYPADIQLTEGMPGIAATVTGLGSDYNAANLVSSDDGLIRLWLPVGDYSGLYVNGVGPYSGHVGESGGLFLLEPVTAPPQGASGLVGQKLSDIELVNPEGNTEGAWTWESPDTLLTNGAYPQSYMAAFVPTRNKLYSGRAHVSVQLLVSYSSVRIDDSQPPAGIVGEEYSYRIMCPDGDTVSEYAADDLPRGLTLDESTGVISGVPETAGAYSAKLYAFAPPRSGEATVTFNVYEKPAFTTDSPLTDGAFGVYMEKQITVTGSGTVGLYVVDGALPPGMELSETGLLSGTPEKSGDFAFTLRAANDWGACDKAFSLHIAPGAATLSGVVSGYCLSEITAPRIVAVTLSGKQFAPTLNVRAETGWIVNLPTGLTSRAVRVSDTQVNIEITGTTDYPYSGEISVVIPGGSISLGGLNVDMNSYAVEATAATRYDIRRPLAASGADFGELTEGYTAGGYVICEIRNDTLSPITGISARLASGVDFAITQQPASALEPGSASGVTVECGERLAVGDYSDTLIITWDNCESGITADVKLTVAELTDSVMTLPSSILEIGAEAFAGGAFKKVIVPDGCISIGARAFADCANLRVVYVPYSVLTIADDAFEGSPDAVVYRY